MFRSPITTSSFKWLSIKSSCPLGRRGFQSARTIKLRPADPYQIDPYHTHTRLRNLARGPALYKPPQQLGSVRYCSFHDRMASAGAPESNKPVAEYRLPTNVKPTHYDITIRSDLEKLKFDGFVVIKLDVIEDTTSIVFNTSEQILGNATLTSPSLQTPHTFSASSYKFDKESERATLELPVALPAGSTAELKIGFSAELTGAMLGYYRSAWEEDGQTKHYALTQFEPTAARKAFPCWDEPLLKATFSVTLVSRENTVALSNMNAISEEPYDPASGKASDDVVSWLSEKLAALTTTETSADKWKVTRFDTTPPMSTYIVAFANGNFSHLEDSYTSPLSGKVRPLRIYTTPDLIHQAQFALDVKKAVLPLYEKVFDIEYPLPKLDTLVATDFDAGAMENWGLITGRTSAFLLDPKSANISAKKSIASTQSHEVAHMWFGNITTMAWWDNLYLNEGFASLMGQVIILGKVFPEWKVDADFISADLNRAFGLDAKLSSHPIEVECPDAQMINQIFDALSYSKAASVLRMLSTYVGEEKFLKGVSTYLKGHLFKNSVTNDLWDGISQTTGIDVSKVMDPWVKKMGFPVVTVEETKDGIKVRQDRFLETGPAEAKDNETIWTIPLGLLTVSADGKPVINHQLVLDEREKFIPLDTSKSYKLNAGTNGVFRVLYPSERLAAIAKQATEPNSPFSLEDRIGLVIDSPALAKAGFSSTSSTLTLIDTFRNEKEFLVWSSMADTVGTVTNTWWEDEEITKGLDAFRRELFVPLVKKLGYEYSDDESVDTKELRTRAVSAAVAAEDPEVIKELTSRFAEFLKTGDDSNIPPDLVRPTYIAAAKYGGKAEYDALKAIAIKPKTPSKGVSAMIAMGAVTDLALAEETFDHIMTKSRDQDVFYYFAGLGQNRKTRRFLAQKFKENYAALNKRLEGNFAMLYLVQYSFQSLCTKKDHDETAEFFKDKDTSKYRMALQQTLDSILAKDAWIQRSTDDVRSWLAARKFV
ncbi:hypothetical protein C8Q75DRAFT_751852 [Abortiporus biennis]|nr:hypothetical protein C8Q75DRAFT_751852 [Abortiporus biennis]